MSSHAISTATAADTLIGLSGTENLGSTLSRQVKPVNKPEYRLTFNMAPESQTKEAWEIWGYVDTDQKTWARGSAMTGIKWEVTGGWLDKKAPCRRRPPPSRLIPKDKIAIIFYIPLKNKEEWEEYISTYKDGGLISRIKKYPNSPCKSYVLIGREYQGGDGEIIDLIHDMSEKF
jgi:hypothetical protein